MKIKEIVEMMIGDALKNFIGSKIEKIVDTGIDKMTTAISGILGLLFFIISFFLFFLFGMISLAFFLSELLGKNYWGFVIISLVYLVLGIIFWVFRDFFFKRPLSKILNRAFKSKFSKE